MRHLCVQLALLSLVLGIGGGLASSSFASPNPVSVLEPAIQALQRPAGQFLLKTPEIEALMEFVAKRAKVPKTQWLEGLARPELTAFRAQLTQRLEKIEAELLAERLRQNPAKKPSTTEAIRAEEELFLRSLARELELNPAWKPSMAPSEIDAFFRTDLSTSGYASSKNAFMSANDTLPPLAKQVSKELPGFEEALPGMKPAAIDEAAFSKFLKSNFFDFKAMRQCIDTMPKGEIEKFRWASTFADLVRTEAFVGGGMYLTYGVKDMNWKDFRNEMITNGLTTVAQTLYTTGGPKQSSIKVRYVRGVIFGEAVRVPLDFTIYSLSHSDDQTYAADLLKRETVNVGWSAATPIVGAAIYWYFLGLKCKHLDAAWSGLIPLFQTGTKVAASSVLTYGYYNIRRWATGK